MTSGSFRFDRFALDPRDRRLTRDDAPVALNARYLDALALLVREQGRLVSKDQFLAEVWRGVPVTDEALTQCIRTLRRQLGDDAARPRFIDTVPKHGYRFVAPVEWVEHDAAGRPPPRLAPAPASAPQILRLGVVGTLAGGGAGMVGGLIYGLLGASQDPDVGAASLLLVLMCLTMAVGLLGGAGVAFGIAIAGRRARHASFTVLGGALGGLAVGAVVKLVGLDAFSLLFGRSPGDITGAPEGFLLGAAVGLGAWIGARSLRRGVVAATLAGVAAGVVISLLGGRLMGGSLALLAERFPASRVRLDPIGALIGEPGFGPLARALTAALEGGLFCACVAAALILTRRDQIPRQHGAHNIPSNVVSMTSETP